MIIEPMDDLVTVEEYFAILAREGNLTPKDIMQKKRFEWFITNCEKNQDLLSPATEDIYAKYKKCLVSLSLKENQTQAEKEIVIDYQRKVLEMEEEKEQEYTRKLVDKAGYVNATIIIVMILNIGFIIAMALLGSK